MKILADRPRRLLTAFTAVLAVGSLATLILEQGFILSTKTRNWVELADIAIMVGFCVQWLLRLALAPTRKAHLRSRWLETLLVALLLAQLVLLFLPGARGISDSIRAQNLTKFYLIVVQLYLVLHALVHASDSIARIGIRPPIVILASFILVVAGGTLLLMLPRCAANPEQPIGLLEAFFTSTSATCVTGLTVLDTGKDFSVTGQWVILGLIQIGGLGLVTFSAFFVLLARGGLGIRQSMMLGEASSYNLLGELGRFLIYVVLITGIVELIGAILLFDAWKESGMSVGERVRWSLFHSVSAFCNAGFGLKSNNLIDYVGSPRMNFTILGLLVIGGLGYGAILNLLQFRVGSLPIIRRWKWMRKRRVGEVSRLTVHTRVVLWMSLLLLVAGTAAFWALEAPGILKGRPAGEQALVSTFQSATCRTAGFNTVDIGSLRVPTLMMMTALMAVGASPGSTGGGVKTVGAAILLATLFSMMRNREHVEIHRRTIPRLIVNQAITVAVLYGFAVFVVSTALSITEPDVAYYKILFETVSALSTVGLTTGITATLSAPGKLIVSLAMMVGRVGPLVVLMSIAGRGPGTSYEYPKEEVAVA